MKSTVSLGLILLKHYTGGAIALQDAVCSMFAAEKASTSAMGRRAAAWRQLNDDTVKHKFDAVLVFKLDQAFR